MLSDIAMVSSNRWGGIPGDDDFTATSFDTVDLLQQADDEGLLGVRLASRPRDSTLAK